jgi:hypothetical protein
MINLNFAPLHVTYRRKLLDLLSAVECNGAQAFSTAFLLGSGPSLPLYTSFAVARSSTTSKIKFYDSADEVGKLQLVSYDSDFGATDSGLSSSWYNRIPDVAILPVTAFAIVPGFHIPELAGETLVLDYDVIAGIYLGTISAWNDQRIQDLNTAQVAAKLPNKSIIVVTQNVSTTTNELFVSVLRDKVPDFAAQVPAGSAPAFPVQDTNRSVVTTDPNGVISLLSANSYSFAFWQLYDVQLVRSFPFFAFFVGFIVLLTVSHNCRPVLWMLPRSASITRPSRQTTPRCRARWMSISPATASRTSHSTH